METALSVSARSSRAPCVGLIALSVLLGNPVSGQTVRGHLLDGTTHEPVMAGVVSLLAENGVDVLLRVEVDSTGAFTLEAPTPGSYWLRGERIGYATRTDGVLDLGEAGFIEVEFYITPQPVELEGLQATVERVDWVERVLVRRLEDWGFFERQKWFAFGHFITPEEIEKRPPNRPHDLFRMIPGMESGQITGIPGTDGIVTFDCGRFAAYVNGIRVHGPGDGAWDMELDISVRDIAAVEVYPRMASLPAQYATMGVCAAILVWTW